MRSIIAGGSLVVLLVAVGCNIAPHRREKTGGGGIVANTPTPTVENLITYLNQNADRIPPGQAVSSRNVPIDVNADGQKVGVDAKMTCQAPRNFLLRGVVFSSPAVDVGSNDQEFWFWSREIRPPYLYHCSYDNLAQGVEVPFPFQPDMIMSALGLAHYDPVKRYQLHIEDDHKGHKAILLTEQALSPEKKPIQKITVFAAHQVRQPEEPQVLAHILKDERGKVVCRANIRSAQQLRENGMIIPRIVDFHWPEQKLKMTMRIENPHLVAMPAAKAATIFTRRNLNYQAFDLATRTLDAGVQRTGGHTSIYRSR